MRPSINWLITDTHLFHDEMVRLCGRPPDFSELLIKNMRHLLAPQDLLIHLGDVIFYKYAQLKEILDSIPCRKVLLMGNHDKKSKGWYGRNGFLFAADMIVLDDVLLSHKPVEILPSGVRINIHGHWHNDNHHKRPDWWKPETHRLLAVEATKYMPVKLADFAK